jgi:hypothetical protein
VITEENQFTIDENKIKAEARYDGKWARPRFSDG